MTRKKKTRSLKNIHNVKTGNTAKLKRQAGSDRQKTKRLKGRRTPSVFEKFLEENQTAKQAVIKDEIAATQKAEQKRHHGTDAPKGSEPPVSQKKPAVDSAVNIEQEPRQEQPKDLLDQLDSSSFKDIY